MELFTSVEGRNLHGLKITQYTVYISNVHVSILTDFRTYSTCFGFFLLVVLIPVQKKLRAKVPLGKQRVRPETQMMIFFQTRRYISLLEFISN